MTTTKIVRSNVAGSPLPDYTTMALYATYLSGIDLSSDLNIQEAVLYNDTEFAVAGAVAVLTTGGATSSFYPYIHPATGQSFSDNPNVRTNALYYNQANGVGINDTASGGSSVCINSSSGMIFARWTGLQFTTSDGASLVNVGQPNQTFTNCIFVGFEIEIGGDNCIFNNCLFVTTFGNPYVLSNFNNSTAFNYCTFIRNPSSSFYIRNTGTATYTNCAFFGGASSGFNTGGGTDTFVNCMTDITGTTGLTGGIAFSTSTGAQFQSLTNDFRVKSGSTLDNGSASPIGGITTDISGFTRKANPTIGAWEVDSGGSTVVLMGQAVF